MSERMASTLLGIVHKDLDAARQNLMELKATLDEKGSAAETQADNFIALLGELDLPAEVTQLLREIVEGNRGLHATVSEWLSIAIGHIERPQKMIREQGFASDAADA